MSTLENINKTNVSNKKVILCLIIQPLPVVTQQNEERTHHNCPPGFGTGQCVIKDDVDREREREKREGETLPKKYRQRLDSNPRPHP